MADRRRHFPLWFALLKLMHSGFDLLEMHPLLAQQAGMTSELGPEFVVQLLRDAFSDLLSTPGLSGSLQWWSSTQRSRPSAESSMGATRRTPSAGSRERNERRSSPGRETAASTTHGCSGGVGRRTGCRRTTSIRTAAGVRQPWRTGRRCAGTTTRRRPHACLGIGSSPVWRGAARHTFRLTRRGLSSVSGRGCLSTERRLASFHWAGGVKAGSYRNAGEP
jgi:hypothetical protein